MGWVLELLYRRYVTNKRWINPGFLVGPYLPLYGFGICAFYLFSGLELSSVLIILIMTVSVTAIEYIAGIIFIKGMGIKLWDYSDRWGNIDRFNMPIIYYILGNTWSSILLFCKSICIRNIRMD